MAAVWPGRNAELRDVPKTLMRAATCRNPTSTVLALGAFRSGPWIPTFFEDSKNSELLGWALPLASFASRGASEVSE